MRALVLLVTVGVAGGQTFTGDRVIPSDSVVGSLTFSSDGSTIAGACADGKVRLWDARSGVLQRAVSLEKGAGIVTLSDHADLLASAGSNGSVSISDLKTGESIHRFEETTPRIRGLRFSPDRKLIAVGNRAAADGSESTLRVWETSGAERLALPAGLGGISAMAFSPDGRTLVAASFDTDLRAWSTRDGELLRLMNELPLATFAAAFSPDGKYLATGGADRVVYLWDTRTWKIARKLPEQPEMISAIAFSPDGRVLLTGGFSEFTVHNPVAAILWDLGSGKALRTMSSPQMIGAAAFSPDGGLAATAGLDGNVRIWAVPSKARQ
jgi:dipeptidyl aminopeptidase/acylaminoacyl peptidase